MVLFQPEIGLIFWMLVVFLIILGILGKFAWPVIIKSMEERAKFIEDGVKFARDAILRKEQADKDAEAILGDAKKRQLEILQEADRLKQKIIADAKEAAVGEVQRMLETARHSAQQMKKEAELQIRNRVALLSLEIAEKVLRKDLSGDEAQKELIDKLLDEVKEG